MRIGMITGEYPPDQGGVGDFTRALGVALVGLGHDIHVITHAAPRPPATDGITVHPVMDGWGWGCWRKLTRLAAELRLQMLDVQYQAAAYGMHPAINLLPRADRPPIVVTFHDLKVPYLFPKAGALRRETIHILARRANGAIVTNREDYIQLEREVPARQLSVIPIGSNIPLVSPARYDRDIERARWGVTPDDVLLGYFGFLNASKGGEELIQTLALLVERGVPAHLLMIGGRHGTSDPTNRQYAAQVQELITGLGVQGRVHWTGYTLPEQVSAGLLAVDLCVLPYRDGVSFRRGTLHACLTHGRPIVTTHPAVPLEEVRDGENMLLAPPQDPRALADAVERLVADPALRAQLATGAASLAAGFTWERIARQTAALFGRLVSGM